MSKLAWVLLPLLAAVAWLALLGLRRRMPARAALNVWFSLLLLAYLLTTAGLGIFWVANQHLPVFDWHYLFGYATVLLLLVHLVFNFRAVWRHLTRGRLAGVAPPADAARRGAAVWMAAAGMGAVGLLGYVLGLRHGRTELTVAASSGAQPTVDTAWAVVERFHAFSSHTRGGVLRRAAGGGWGDPPPSFKHYEGAAVVRLPKADSSTTTQANTHWALNLHDLGAMLWHTAGVSEQRGPIYFRTSPSSGALFSTELYVGVGAGNGLQPGWWHYDALNHQLEKVSDAALDLPVWLGTDAASAGDPPAVIVATAVFARSGHKYRDRTYRYVLADLGHGLENLHVAAGVLGWQVVWPMQFDESRLAAVLKIDESQEGPLAVAVLQPPGVAWRSPTANWLPAPVAADASTPVAVTQAIHRATSLRLVAGSALQRPLPPGVDTPSTSTAHIALPPPTAIAKPMLDIIARRRSVRRYADRAVLLPDLSALLHAMAPRGLTVLSPAVRIDVVAQGVQGLPPGRWRYDPASAVLHQRTAPTDVAALRNQSRRAALDQDVIGDAAAVFVLSIDRAAMTRDAAGPARGYRHAFLEAGRCGERLYLAAGALGLGVCAVGAFYDEEAQALVALDAEREWAVHFAALGVPA
jgi:SagB-type dehydrogenase family enzyme